MGQFLNMSLKATKTINSMILTIKVSLSCGGGGEDGGVNNSSSSQESCDGSHDLCFSI